VGEVAGTGTVVVRARARATATATETEKVGAGGVLVLGDVVLDEKVIILALWP